MQNMEDVNQVQLKEASYPYSTTPSVVPQKSHLTQKQSLALPTQMAILET